MLRIALIPCLVVLLFGGALSVYLIRQGGASLEFADARRSGLPVVGRYVASRQEERRLTMAVLGGSEADRPRLAERRRVVDAELVEVIEYARGLADGHSPELRPQVVKGEEYLRTVPETRAALDSGATPALAGFDFFNQVLDVIGIGSKRLAASADDAAVAFEHVVSSDLFFVIESVSRAHALGVYTEATGDHAARTRLGALTAQYRQPPTAVIANLTEDERGRFTRLLRSPDWATLIAGDQALVTAARFDVAAWERAAANVVGELSAIYLSHSAYTADLAERHGDEALLWSVIAGIVIALIAGLVAVFAFRAAAKLISRLKDLRRRTLQLADHELPALIEQVGAGTRIDPDTDVSRVDFGADEIGEVAQAFDKAQHVALSAAVAEVETRRGVRAVFLNIAHRSQGVVHRQLEELDQIERSEDNPELLDRLFRLDHLATRSRRNAENLIILGGEQVGRQWRRPVALSDVVRGAVSETKHYTRVSTPSLPDVLLDGSAVADVGHLLAELVDNGTAFSPPESRVEVRGNLVGKGVVVEVEDQGMGIAPDQLTEINRTLCEPPDFSFMALADELRIGLFVVARLAAKHRIRVTLRESAYGGIQAIVLLPSMLLAASAEFYDDGERPEPQPEPAPEPEPEPASALTAPVSTARVMTDRPPLPTRVRQNSLAPQLREADRTEPEGESWTERDVDRSSTALAAFQRGSARARSEAAAATAGPEVGGE
ncbi:histidine kinase/DNA gyrase B/HSP90-like ATPase [Herbihabitans rhizosphaerae]|uniref:histidine kinase n=1 Tax=Herbihabitans rhizosphaerae TaxID=1872711 RepID=A0A4Q7L6R6_9PSEU|nr:histidine kinase/DNA gyrase B/HSP90-like ATPase [Herbihabitans rhizosphaerae]